MTRFCWDESKRRIPVTVKEGEPAGRRWYFVNPVGSYLQNEHLMNVHVNYCVSRRIKNEWLDEILSAQEPVLRCELMCETEPGANDFLPRTVDLVCVFIQYLDYEKLKHIVDEVVCDDINRFFPYSELVLENVHDSHFANSIAELLKRFE